MPGIIPVSPARGFVQRRYDIRKAGEGRGGPNPLHDTIAATISIAAVDASLNAHRRSHLMA